MQAYCEQGDHYPDELIADVGEELGVIVYGDGTASNRFEDGVVGIGRDRAARAEEDEEPVCPDHLCPVRWQR